MSKPIIGVLPLWDDERHSIWMLPEYMEAVSLSGGVPVILPLDIADEDIEQLCSQFDGFLFTGGHDVNPSLYGEDKGELCGELCISRDRLESAIFDYAIEHNIPILGICRGIQLINVLCGGTLYQDLPSEYDASCRDRHHMSPPYDMSCHRVRVTKESPLYQLVQSDILDVNSYHHQAVKELSPSLVAMAHSEDGLVEALYMPSQRFVWAVQWHPEYNFHTSSASRSIVRAFIETCIEPAYE